MNIRTIMVKIGENADFDQLCERFLSACNWISPIVYSTKQLHSLKLHAKYYDTIRKEFNLP